MIWKQKAATRDPGVTARALVPGSRLAPFSIPVPTGLGKMGGRDDKVWAS